MNDHFVGEIREREKLIKNKRKYATVLNYLSLVFFKLLVDV